MEKKQYDLCLEVLRRLSKAKILDNVIIIGSWCSLFYREYFKDTTYSYSIKTRDIDFLVPFPTRFQEKVDVPGLLKDLGFVVGFKWPEGYVRLEHPQLIVEFLVSERGKGFNKPYELKQVGLNAQALRYLDLLTQEVIRIKVNDFSVALPHPALFALHKLILFQERRKADKVTKDKEIATRLIKTLIKNGELITIKHIFDSINKKWQKKIIKGLELLHEKEILELLLSKRSFTHVL